MFKQSKIQGHAAVLHFANFDTDQIMPKQFLRGIDKSGLAEGLFYNLRFDEAGNPKADFFLNQPIYANVDILIAGPNYGCGSSREHAVWGMQQFGFKAVIASSFAEIFYSNGMGNGLLLALIPEVQVQALKKEADDNGAPISIDIDIENCVIRTLKNEFKFTISPRHQRMFLEGLDVIGLTLKYKNKIDKFSQNHWNVQPWVKNVARITCERLAKE